MSIHYYTTNENIYAVREGLNPSKGDNIYSIFASGDIPFMFIENGAKVLGVDHNRSQVNYGKKRISALISDNKKMFKSFRYCSSPLLYENSNLREKYFEEINIDLVRENLSNLEIVLGDFFNLENDIYPKKVSELNVETHVDYSLFNKVYLSNAFDHYLDNENISFVDERNLIMNKFFDKFDSGTIFYMTGKYLNYNFSKLPTVNFFEIDSFRLSSMDKFWNVYLFEKK